jgi:hypothetical protein
MLCVVLAAILAAPGATAQPAASPAKVSRAAAESLLRKIDTMVAATARRPKTPAPVPVTEDELNSYLNLMLLPTLPTTVRDVAVELETGRLEATGVVDIDEVKEELKLSPWNPLSLLSGEVAVRVAGRYLAPKDGFGRVEIDEVRAGRIPIPVSVIEQLVARSTRSEEHPEGVDIRAPFRLPHPVRRLRLEPGRALLDL